MRVAAIMTRMPLPLASANGSSYMSVGSMLEDSHLILSHTVYHYVTPTGYVREESEVVCEFGTFLVVPVCCVESFVRLTNASVASGCVMIMWFPFEYSYREPSGDDGLGPPFMRLMAFSPYCPFPKHTAFPSCCSV